MLVTKEVSKRKILIKPMGGILTYGHSWDSLCRLPVNILLPQVLHIAKNPIMVFPGPIRSQNYFWDNFY